MTLDASGDGQTVYLGAPTYEPLELHTYDVISDTWTSLGSVPSGTRPTWSCGVAPNRKGEKEVVLAGGDFELNVVDFYNLETGQWRTSSEWNIYQMFLAS